MLFSQGREIVVKECPNASISLALMTHWLVAALRRHWLEQLSWSVRWLRLSQDTVAWWHWQSHHRQRPRMHREREKESMCGVVLKTPVSKSRRGGRMVRRNDMWAVACTKRCGIHLSFFSRLSCVWEGIRFYVCVCPATWMNNLEVFKKSRTAGSDW